MAAERVFNFKEQKNGSWTVVGLSPFKIKVKRATCYAYAAIQPFKIFTPENFTATKQNLPTNFGVFGVANFLTFHSDLTTEFILHFRDYGYNETIV